jgi:hypothetical protein
MAARVDLTYGYHRPQAPIELNAIGMTEWMALVEDFVQSLHTSPTAWRCRDGWAHCCGATRTTTIVMADRD